MPFSRRYKQLLGVAEDTECFVRTPENKVSKVSRQSRYNLIEKKDGRATRQVVGPIEADTSEAAHKAAHIGGAPFRTNEQ